MGMEGLTKLYIEHGKNSPTAHGPKSSHETTNPTMLDTLSLLMNLLCSTYCVQRKPQAGPFPEEPLRSSTRYRVS